MKNHGVNLPRGINAEASFSGRFGKLFPSLPRLISDPKDLECAGMKDGPMDSNRGPIGATDTPLGYVFLGQFIDHDITLDITSSFDKLNDPFATQNFRTPALDLDCIYGSGPEASPHLYYQAPEDGSDFQKSISDRHLLTMDDDLARAPSSPEGNPKRAALIGDPRNDENRVISQIQLCMHYFHNKVVDYLLKKIENGEERLEGSEVFEEAQKLTRWHYQWVIVHDFLPRIVGQEVVDEILCDGTKIYQTEEEPYIPIEFAVAAYRFGHTMVQERLRYNKIHSNVQLFGKELGKGFCVNQAGLADLDFIFSEQQPAGAVDIRLPGSLLDLPFLEPTTPAPMKSLATRNLLRGQSFGLPSGQQVHKAISQACGTELDTPNFKDTDLPDNLTKSTPLWLYILAEGSISNGKRLGPVGGRIVAEVLIGLLESDRTSYLGADRSWHPEFAIDGKWDMPTLIKVAHNGVAQ